MSEILILEMQDERIATAKESKKDIKPGSVVTCIDDRFLCDFGGAIPDYMAKTLVTKEEELGPQIPGGSIGIMAILAETAPEDEALDFDKLYEIVEKTHKLAGYRVGVHMDDNHGHVTAEQALSNIERALKNPNGAELPGCGYAAMLTADSNPLRLKPKTVDYFKNLNIVPEMVAKGARLACLTGHHANPQAGEALAVSNTEKGRTLDHQKLEDFGLKIYGHDPLAAEDIIMHMAEVVEELNKPVWAENIRRLGVQIEREHHRIAVLALAGMEPVEI